MLDDGVRRTSCHADMHLHMRGVHGNFCSGSNHAIGCSETATPHWHSLHTCWRTQSFQPPWFKLQPTIFLTWWRKSQQADHARQTNSSIHEIQVQMVRDRFTYSKRAQHLGRPAQQRHFCYRPLRAHAFWSAVLPLRWCPRTAVLALVLRICQRTCFFAHLLVCTFATHVPGCLSCGPGHR